MPALFCVSFVCSRSGPKLSGRSMHAHPKRTAGRCNRVVVNGSEDQPITKVLGHDSRCAPSLPDVCRDGYLSTSRDSKPFHAMRISHGHDIEP